MSNALDSAAMRCPFCQQGNQCMSTQLDTMEVDNLQVDIEQIKRPQINDPLNKSAISLAKNAANANDASSTGKGRRVATEQSASCWCFVQKIPQALIDLVPASSQHKHCICQRCVNAFEGDPVAFQRRYCC